jgi:hypothetical protein
MRNNFAPIAIFCFNRVELLTQSLHSLSHCLEFKDSPIYVFSDGPRNKLDIPRVNAVREILVKELPLDAVIIKREQNLGLAENIIDGVNTVCSKHGRVIVLEDDLLFDRRFLHFMNSCLDAYQDDPNIFQISGHTPSSEIKSADGKTVALTITDSWGWGTWSRAWSYFDRDAKGWCCLTKDRALRKRFNLNNKYDYYTMLRNQMLFNIDSWAIRWYWSVFKSEGLVIYPPINLVDNCGMKGDGSHGRGWFRHFDTPTIGQSSRCKISVVNPIVLRPEVQSEVFEIIWSQNGKYLGRLVDNIKRIYWAIRYFLGWL